MIRVEVKNRISQELITRAQFNTQQEVDSWIEDCKKSECFGKNERWIREGEESISNAIESRIIEIYPAQEEILDEDMNIIQEAREAITRTEYKLAAEYTIEQLDISAQINQERINQEALAYLASTDWMVIRAIESGVSVPTEITTARAAARLSIIR